jgi:hypothetical protein
VFVVRVILVPVINGVELAAIYGNGFEIGTETTYEPIEFKVSLRLAFRSSTGPG